MKEYNFKDIVKNDSFGEKNFEIKIGDVPIDLTNVDIRLQFREKLKNGALAKTLTIGDGITITDATAGKFRIDNFIVDFNVDVYWYDVQFTFPDNTVKTYFGGYMRVVQDVTQNA